MMANPFEIFDTDILMSRGIRNNEVAERFCTWASFIADDLCEFFNQYKVGTTTWADVKEAILSDRDASWSAEGTALFNALLDKA